MFHELYLTFLLCVCEVRDNHWVQWIDVWRLHSGNGQAVSRPREIRWDDPRSCSCSWSVQNDLMSVKIFYIDLLRDSARIVCIFVRRFTSLLRVSSCGRVFFSACRIFGMCSLMKLVHSSVSCNRSCFACFFMRFVSDYCAMIFTEFYRSYLMLYSYNLQDCYIIV